MVDRIGNRSGLVGFNGGARQVRQPEVRTSGPAPVAPTQVKDVDALGAAVSARVALDPRSPAAAEPPKAALARAASFLDFKSLSPLREGAARIAGHNSASVGVQDAKGNALLLDVHLKAVHFVDADGRGFTHMLTPLMGDALARLLEPAIREQFPGMSEQDVAQQNPLGLLYSQLSDSTCLTKEGPVELSTRHGPWELAPEVILGQCARSYDVGSAEELLSKLSQLNVAPEDRKLLNRATDAVSRYARTLRAQFELGGALGQSAETAVKLLSSIPAAVAWLGLESEQHPLAEFRGDLERLAKAVDANTQPAPVVRDVVSQYIPLGR